jgi:hypothetical protein
MPEDIMLLATENLKIMYFSTLACQYLLEFIEILDNYYSFYDMNAIKLYWHYKNGDKDMEESGREFALDINLPFTFVTYD